MNNAFKPYLFIILSCSLEQFINFFFLFFCHYFMYPNNNLHQKLAVSEILNNVSLSLSLFWGPYSYIMCTCFFFLGWMHYVYQWVKEEKLSIQNMNFFLIFFIFYTLLHYLIKVKTIFFTQLFKRLPLSTASNNWFNRQRCHVVKFYLKFCLMMILSPTQFQPISNIQAKGTFN